MSTKHHLREDLLITVSGVQWKSIKSFSPAPSSRCVNMFTDSTTRPRPRTQKQEVWSNTPHNGSRSVEWRQQFCAI